MRSNLKSVGEESSQVKVGCIFTFKPNTENSGSTSGSERISVSGYHGPSIISDTLRQPGPPVSINDSAYSCVPDLLAYVYWRVRYNITVRPVSRIDCVLRECCLCQIRTLIPHSCRIYPQGVDGRTRTLLALLDMLSRRHFRLLFLSGLLCCASIILSVNPGKRQRPLGSRDFCVPLGNRGLECPQREADRA